MNMLSYEPILTANGPLFIIIVFLQLLVYGFKQLFKGISFCQGYQKTTYFFPINKDVNLIEKRRFYLSGLKIANTVC